MPHLPVTASARQACRSNDADAAFAPWRCVRASMIAAEGDPVYA